jgi:rfaE bifunctional protein kinase chain/domain
LVQISEARLDAIIAKMTGKRIAVVGDLMLDRYIWGSVSRISPEAPVPVIDMENEQARLGGAANVAKNIKSLGGDPLLVGVIGADNSGRQLHEIINECGFSTDGVVVDSSRPTTVKTRVIANNQHVVRIDRESKSDISDEIQRSILGVLARSMNSVDGIIIEDYNKGVIAEGLIARLIQLANENKKIITVDPKFNNFFEYRNVTVFKPNRKEAEEVLGQRLRTDEDIFHAGTSLQKRLQCASLLLTLGEQGMALFEPEGTMTRVPTWAQNVQDVSGAGDTVISTLTMALSGGATMKEAATLANFAGGIVCGYVGIVPIDRSVLRNEILRRENHHSQITSRS